MFFFSFSIFCIRGDNILWSGAPRMKLQDNKNLNHISGVEGPNFVIMSKNDYVQLYFNF